MIDCDEMPDSFHKTIYEFSKRGSMHRTLVLNLAFNTWDKSELKRLEASEFRDDMFKYLTDALRADGVEGWGVQEVLDGMPQGVYWEREGCNGEGGDDHGETEVEDYTDTVGYFGLEGYTKVTDYTDGGDETKGNAGTGVKTEIETKTEANIETKQDSESDSKSRLEFEAETEYFYGM
ncbi:hypothetical protein G6514_007063 [Epicoccum nigrum]|nr:hypothetical protein G6514_007063 [Epicoccum nigrum]